MKKERTRSRWLWARRGVGSHGCCTSTALAIERVLGTDCTDEFAETHDKHQTKMLREYAIGTLCDEPDDAATAGDAAEPDALGF